MTQCPAVSSGGRPCHYIAGHPCRTHVDLSSGWPHPWTTPDENWQNRDLSTGYDPLRDAPEALARHARQEPDQ